MIIYTYDCSFHPPSRAAHPQENRLNWPRVRLQRLCLTLHSHSTYQSHLLTLKKASQSALKARRHLASLRANPRQNHRPSPAVSHLANHLVNPVHSRRANPLHSRIHSHLSAVVRKLYSSLAFGLLYVTIIEQPAFHLMNSLHWFFKKAVIWVINRRMSI